MSSTFKKLNLKNQRQIVVLNVPETFERELNALRDIEILRDLQDRNEIEFSLAFVTKQKEVDSLGTAIAKRPKAMLWCGSRTRRVPPRST